MAVWEKASLDTDTSPGSKVHVNPAGSVFIKILSPKFRLNDVSGDYGVICFGMKLYVP